MAVEEVTNPQALAVQAPTPMVLLQMAMSQGADLEKLSKLMDLQERWENNEARKAYTAAMAAFKAELPVLLKNKRVSFDAQGGKVEYNHATLDNVVAVASAGMSKHGLMHAWKVEQANGQIKVTCTVTHEMGHSESVTMECGPDATGKKNAIQQIASAVTYLERYTLMAITGMAAKDQDDDAASAGERMDENAAEDYLTAIQDASTKEELQKVFTEAYQKASKLKDKRAMAQFIAAKDRRKAELR